MGGKSSSSSSQSTRTTTNQYDQRLVVEDNTGGVVLGADAVGNNSTVEYAPTDYGVIDGAGEILKIGFGTINDVVSFAGNVVKDTQQILAEQQESDTKEIGQLAITSVVVIGVLILGLAIWIVRRR